MWRSTHSRDRISALPAPPTGSHASRSASEIDLLIGTGGAHQGVLAAAAIRSAGGEMQARFAPRNQQEAEACLSCGILDLKRRFPLEELAGDNVMFAATGVTTGDYLY